MKILVIQTAFIGDVILATALLEEIHAQYPGGEIDFLVRKGNEGLLSGHPFIRRLLIFDKQHQKYRNLWRLIRQIRREKYEVVVNVQRFFTTGLLTVLSGARQTIGFDKNPLSSFFTHAVPHHLGTSDHEVMRNLTLLSPLFGPARNAVKKPKLYPSASDFEQVPMPQPYVCIAPSSVWYTKQLPAAKWIALINAIPAKYHIVLLGGKGDIPLCQQIMAAVPGKSVSNLAGQLSLLASAAVISKAAMTFSNDSAPAHLASAMDAPITMIYCSTVPGFGFGPLSTVSFVAETSENLTCRPCGLHGKKACPLGHFRCAEIDMAALADRVLPKTTKGN